MTVSSQVEGAGYFRARRLVVAVTPESLALHPDAEALVGGRGGGHPSLVGDGAWAIRLERVMAWVDRHLTARGGAPASGSGR